MNPTIQIRPINAQSTAEIALVAQRMRQTLCEVLGEERGRAMYSMEWLKERVQWHLDANKVVAKVYLAEADDGEVVGHTIVRIDKDDEGNNIGLFTTTYVDPESRRLGVATLLLQQGEQWMQKHSLTIAATYTDKENVKLQNLYIRHGYVMRDMPDDFVKLAKSLAERDGAD